MQSLHHPALEAFPYTLHFHHPAPTSRGVLHTRTVVFVRAQQDGRIGWGECGVTPGLSRDDTPDYVEQVQRVCQLIQRGARAADLDLRAWPSIAFGLESARLAVDVRGAAVFDTPFARGEVGLLTHGLVWMDTRTGLLRQIEGKIAQGHRVIKLKVGALPLADEMGLLQMVRQRWPAHQIELRLDANGAWQPGEAQAALEALAPLEIAWLEQPIAAGQLEAMAALCAASPIPLALDEELIAAADPAALLDRIRPQHVVLKPSLLGGLAACARWIAAAEARGIQWWINSLLEANIGLNIIAQWCSTLPGARVHGIGSGQLYQNNVPPFFRMQDAALWRDASTR